MIQGLYPGSDITVSTSDASLWDGYDYYTENNIHFVPWAWDYGSVESNRLYWSFLKKIKKYTFSIFRESILRGLTLGKALVNPQFRNAVKCSDVVISVGGHHFTTILSRDLVSGINFDAMAVMAEKKKLICFSQSFGPFVFHNPQNLKLTNALLSGAYLMPREEQAEEVLVDFLGQTDKIKPTKESVLTLSKYIEYTPVSKRDDAVGIAIYCTQARTLKEKDYYQTTIATFCNHVISKGLSVRFFPMEIKGTAPDDRPFIKEIISKVDFSERCYVYDNDMETIEHLQEVAKCKVFVGHKTHSTIFALATGTPLMAIAYHPKTIEFLSQYGLQNNSIKDSELTVDWLTSSFDALYSNLDMISKLEYQRSKEFGAQIERDFAEAVSTVTEDKVI